MAANIDRIDILGQSSLFKSAQDVRQDRARRGVVVTGLDGTSYGGDIDAAISHLFSELPATHPADDSLPIMGTQLQPLRPGVVQGAVLYGHSNATNPTQDPWAFAATTLAYERKSPIWTRRYRHAGTLAWDTEDITPAEGALWDGYTKEWDDWDEDLRGNLTQGFANSTVRAPVVQFTVDAGLLESDPSGTLSDLHGAVNSDGVSINGSSRGSGTLKFIHARALPIHTPAGIRFATTYIFHWSPQGWGNFFRTYRNKRSDTYIENGINYTAYYNVPGLIYIPPGKEESFGNSFPTFDGPGP